jgi:tetratricopeptide (TPR) repeat protein
VDRRTPSGGHVDIEWVEAGTPRRVAGVELNIQLSNGDDEDLRWYLEDYLQYPADPAPEYAAQDDPELAPIRGRPRSIVAVTAEGMTDCEQQAELRRRGGMEVRRSMMNANEARRLRTTSHAAMLAERAPWPARASAGDIAAAITLGEYFYRRNQRAEAERWFGQAVASGSPEGCHDLGVMRQEDGRAAEAEELFKRAAEAGYSKSMNNLAGSAMQRGDHDNALKWAGKAAEAGNLTGMINYGVLLLGAGRNEEARKWFDAAIQAGDLGTQQRIADQVRMSGLTLP